MKKILVLGVISMVFAGCSKEIRQPRNITTELTCESGSIQVKHYGSEMSPLPADFRVLCEKAIASPATARSKVTAYDSNPAGWTGTTWVGSNLKPIEPKP